MSPPPSSADGSFKSWVSSYTVPVEVGTPPQTLDIIVDTGSSNFWVFGDCDNSTECGLVQEFHAGESSTFTPTARKFEVAYVDGGMQTGHWGYDMVTVGGWTVNASVAVSDKAFNWVTRWTGSWASCLPGPRAAPSRGG